MELEARLQAGVRYILENPHAKQPDVARQFRVNCSMLRSRLKACGYYPYRPAGSYAYLKPTEEKAICNYIDHLDRVGIAVRAEFIAEVAASIVRAKTRPSGLSPPTIGAQWVSRFAQRHGYFERTQKMIEPDRMTAEEIEVMANHFEELREIIAAERIVPEDMWNMNNTSFHVGSASDQLIITRKPESSSLPAVEAPEETLPQTARSPSPAGTDESDESSSDDASSSSSDASGTRVKTSSTPADTTVTPADKLSTPANKRSTRANKSSTSVDKSSIPATTSTTLSRVHEAGYEIQRLLEESEDLDPELARPLGQFIRNFIIDATKLLKTKPDTGRKTRSSARIQKRSASKRTPLKYERSP